ncbi:stress responsive alpha-beta barrel domain-containing protein [Rozella allomycis CSF55]|uniref:Stress responsive alpha-beta barrel domain-containing protein n=1 Tax=Rozella allomycis (strain CSF55) TaxID=988480 RepID=A0A075ASJ7_ROZAC|nr:hypothetical protein O9G_003111 [Rozella allomycis CSF55]RKP18580.1 stress responsive alpha-beta barrel domain-containing protein [Rozella allomycis CSF55]|eukprot:EPZ33115.1 hypothetical protein O9G_003111 [Rozella allomycis CSF55]
MAVEHVVFLKLKQMNSEEWRTISETFHGMKNKIPGILDMSIGSNFNAERNKGFTHALRVKFQDEQSLQKYADHPLHLHFKKLLVHESDPICLDWKC